MELRHVRYFVALAEELNFTRAAARLGIGQPPLSQQIRDLETEIGYPLFLRRPHGAELTEAGRAFLAEARQILEQAERAKEAARRAGGGHVGALRVGFTSSANFHPAVTEAFSVFHWTYPDASLIVEESHSARLTERLLHSELDAAFVRPGNVAAGGLDLLPLGEEPLILALPVGHHLATQARVPVAALRQEPFVIFSQGIGRTFLGLIREACAQEGFEPLIAQETPHIVAMINMVAAGLGVAMAPGSIAQLAVRGVVYRPLDGAVPKVPLAIATRAGDVSPLVRNFLALIPPPAVED
ncbi:LysR substrate-binding domain-containing protein [Caulobacter endophyticus]|uniref:LysR substrate-binding domain-containing protein n=1 Tax=Caulobacter endophyticus TaxID=2172652 RepID=UPI00240FB809|nr:LysR substrate-binding domain-containing protein [Caulobacter endophyticus]MDG2531795.1 LysR substrate-binding domain-containing protein [Caulobacter endophyticus]